MKEILVSIISLSSKEILDSLLESSKVSDKESLLSSQELSYLNYLQSSYDNSGSFPSLNLLCSQFPELSSQVSDVSPLSESDLRVYIANFLKQRSNLSISQSLIKLASKVSQSGITPDIQDSLSSLLPIQSQTNKNVDTLDSFRSYYEGKKGKPQGLITNIKAIDEAIGGLPYGHLLNIFGYVASMKSLWVNNIVYHNAMELKYNLCIISLEVPKEDVLANLITRHSASSQFSSVPFLPTSKIRNSELTSEEESLMFDTILPDFYDYTNHGFIKILDESDFKTFSFSEIQSMLIQVDDECRQKTGYPLDGFVVDHINLCKYHGASASRLSVGEIGNQYISFFHSLSMNFRHLPDGTIQQLAGIIIAQANRDGWKKARKNKGKYDLTAISEFNEIERSCQIICSVYTSEEMKLAKEASVQCLKNRFGPTVEEPQVVYCNPEAYTLGDDMEGFNDSMEMSDLESVFGSGDIADLL